MSSKAKTAARPTPQPTNGVVPPPAEVKAVAPIPVDAVVRAYLEKKLGDLKHTLSHLQEDRRETEVGAIAQLNRVLGQKDGEIKAVQDQIKGIEEELAPPSAPPTEETPEEQPAPEPVAA